MTAAKAGGLWEISATITNKARAWYKRSDLRNEDQENTSLVKMAAFWSSACGEHQPADPLDAIFQMAEVEIPRGVFVGILAMINALRGIPRLKVLV